MYLLGDFHTGPESKIFSPRSLPMIVTPYSHILYTIMLHFALRSFSAILCNRMRLRSKKIMRMFLAVSTVLRYFGMFQGSVEVYKPLLYDSGQVICFL